MKKMSLIFTFFFVSFICFAQSNKEEIDMMLAEFGKQKKELVQSAMTIPQAQTAAFWTEYDVYEDSRKVLARDRIKLIQDYASAYQTIDDKKSSELMERKLNWLNDYTKLQRKYYGSFSKIIGGKQASKFFQIEDYLENVLRLSIQLSIPFIGDLDKANPKPKP